MKRQLSSPGSRPPREVHNAHDPGAAELEEVDSGTMRIGVDEVDACGAQCPGVIELCWPGRDSHDTSLVTARVGDGPDLLIPAVVESAIVRRRPRRVAATLGELSRLTTFDRAMGDFMGPIWKSLSLSDAKIYPLVRETSATAG